MLGLACVIAQQTAHRPVHGLQALDSKVPQPAKPAVAYTEPPAKRIRFQDDATGRLSADAPSSTPGEAGTTELHRLGPSSEPPLLEPAPARHLAQVHAWLHAWYLLCILLNLSALSLLD